MLTGFSTESSNKSDITRYGSVAADLETLDSRLSVALVLTELVRLRRKAPKAASRSRGVTERLQHEVTWMRSMIASAHHYLPEVAEPALVVRLT